jgi:hypothetical protein
MRMRMARIRTAGVSSHSKIRSKCTAHVICGILRGNLYGTRDWTCTGTVRLGKANIKTGIVKEGEEEEIWRLVHVAHQLADSIFCL